MSFSSLLASAASQAQSVLAPMTDPDAEGEYTISGATYTGTMSIFDRVLVATPNGYEEQRQIKIASTRAQFTVAPDPSTRPPMVAKGFNWRLTAIEPGAQFYTLTGVAA